MTILDQILEKKIEEVQTLKLAGLNYKSSLPKNEFSLYDSFKHSDALSVIAEVKRASPSKGDINIGMEPSEQAKTYELSGAGAVSVLTDQPFFKGSMDDLAAVRQTIDLPILNKDFIIDEIQIDRAHQAGANVILLIAKALDRERLKELYQYAQSQNLEVLFEVHNEEDLEDAFEVGAKIIGINNRDLKTFQVNLETTERLAKQITNPDTLIISESGIKTREEAKRVAKAGAEGILVGESLMLSGDVTQTLSELKIEVPSV
ncbi:indole-3-glycerol phosphate synthase TrpC [Aquisalibacillus elongatus]|uniref:Indole-3-glycerol phosphate synthase n=1 Tax=Aquisalibacillus elongatus TaxID=485577 RepID=A0A3N5B7I4_9BACI|nr:indole-3-glycerol phosphate synthase TrpC [Aquisalibacillus elongatus]RPF53267.1 indole-3-glycerol phosphate synthase [Aquisalibacillus elongatus]